MDKPEDWKYAPVHLHYYDAKTAFDQGEFYLIMLEYRQDAFHAPNDHIH